MITRFKCNVCNEIKIEIWLCEKNQGDDGRAKGDWACQECREIEKKKNIIGN